MKKLAIVIFAAMTCICISVAAHATDPVIDEPIEAYEIFTNDTFAIDEPFPEDIAIPDATVQGGREIPMIPIGEPLPPRLADGEAGRGTIENIAEYWAKNGYPDNISYAYHAGGESPPYNPDIDRLPPTAVTWWEVGIVGADAAARQKILALMSPDCRVIFRDCTWSHKQREAAFNEIYASRDAIVRDAWLGENTEAVFVEIVDGYEKEYAKKFIDKFGAFIVVTNKITAENDAVAGGGIPEMGLDTGGILDMDSGLGIGETAGNPFGPWFWVLCLSLLAGAAMLVYFNRARLIPALQTANGNVVTGNARISKKQTEAAIKNSTVTPSDEVFGSILQRLDNPEE